MATKNRQLTPKQKLFVLEYLKDLNATQACIRAGYSKKNAGKIGPELLGKTRVKEEIDKAMGKRAERLEVDADWVLNRLLTEAQADLADLYDDEGNVLSIKEWPLIWRQGLVAGIDQDNNGIKLRLSDRIRRIDMIAKHVGVQAFSKKVEHSGNLTLESIVATANQGDPNFSK